MVWMNIKNLLNSIILLNKKNFKINNKIDRLV